MRYENLSETVSIKKISETETNGVFEIDGLYTGYGITLGNSLRRVLLSSLPGVAITQVKIKGVNHEFSTVPGVLEDVVEIILNLKKVRFKMFTEEPQVLTLKSKGEGVVKASEIKTNAQVELVNPDALIATISEKNADLDIELTVEKGLGYVPSETRRNQKMGVGVIPIDAIFTPVIAMNFSVDNMRVEDKTDYNKLTISIQTDGSIAPSAAIKKASEILESHFKEVAKVEIKEGSMKVVEASTDEDKDSEESKDKKAKKEKKPKKAKK